MFRLLNRPWTYLRSPSIRQLIIPAGCVLYWSQRNSTQYRLSNDSLKPLSQGDTYEMGLYLASQQESQRHIEQKRCAYLQRSRNTISFHTRKFWYLFKDHLIEPVFTLLRFIEIFAIFAPVLICYPITYFGKHHRLDNDQASSVETSGSLIWYGILRRALELAGPSFIKLGQWAGSRTDMFSRGLCHELSHLHSNAKSHSLRYSKKKICQSLGNKFEFDEIFDEFREKPLGVGAIAQVYVGKLSEKFIKRMDDQENDFSDCGTRWCAVKVIHPNCGKKINRDLKIMRFFASAIDLLPGMEWLSLPAEVEQFSILMRLQLDLRIESLNLTRFNKNFHGSLQAKFPRGFPQFSSRDVLFEEYIHGFPMASFLEVKDRLNSTELCKKVSDPFIDAFLQMLIMDDFIHADLHPGNVMIRFLKTDRFGTKNISSEQETFQVVHRLRRLARNDDPALVDELKATLRDYTPQICFIDAGLVTELNKQNRANFIALFNALARFDGYRAGELMIERSKTPETAIDKELFALKVEKLVSKVKKRTFTLGTVSIGDLLDQMLTMVRNHHVRMEGDFVSVVVAILLLEGIGRQLDPDLDLFSSSLPILREFGSQRETNSLLHDASTLSMLKIWIGLEIRQIMTLSARHMKDLVKADLLCPNY
ncbi:ZYBA0S10-03884g1_1 [Zygosaccharomyces bailii CLIB 213]|uniref:ZYBA0S10-03884g1_1 n=1 Tax=Zygosaccharomyces bailii (strain CLIB 213 / ATCC 58445 / CBS 680 / BCRC 21525 / NBRC 1098 / NCYC 1416 / NRRL Y-2227) TaxID=1333698 RepID=A0A8J2XA25_ZYGB2|nr:ZYBA0S10-03884g1_1 [Zygosaccharomyces bailii CLIB 213]